MDNVLDRVNNPTDLKRLSMPELARLAEDIRAFLVGKVAVTGGHLASNLGAVELTIALHYVFDLLVDRVVWDVGHQAYVHKILTGRKARFATLRQLDGLSGFPKRGESPYDAFETGHSSTSISVAAGIAHAKTLRGEPGKAIAVIGDGSLTSGLAFEALNNAGHLKDDVIVILNDNEMSISPNVGALSEYLNRLLAAPVYNKFRDDVEELIKRIPNVGQKGYQLTKRIEASLKHMLVPRTLFEEFGFRYLGPIDGHRLEPLIEILRQCRNLHGPLLLHVITTKGCGYRPAEQHPTQFHGVGPFDPDSGEVVKCPGVKSYTQIFGETVQALAERDPRIVAITAAMPDGTGLARFAREMPKRFVDVGIAEGHAVTFAGGLAATGLRPIVAIYSTFLQRSYDSVVHDICLPNLPVILALDRAGIVGEDGETHQGVFDFAYLRHIPNLTVMAPADEAELVQMLETALTLNAPVAIRYPRGCGRGVAMASRPALRVAEAEVRRAGDRVLLLAIGDRVEAAEEAAARLVREGLNPTVINARFIKPLDETCIIAEAKRHQIIVTMENHVVAGGFGSAVNELLLQHRLGDRRIINLGFPDKFIEHGSPAQLFARYGLDATGIVHTVLAAINKP